MHRAVGILLLCCAAASAQVLDATKIGDSVPLSGNWRIHTGDDPKWADPAFNDSDWRVISTQQQWDSLGLQGVRGFIWYRAKVNLPESHGALSLLRTDLGPSEIYIDGKRLAITGSFPPNMELVDEFVKAYRLPQTGKEMSIALRYYLPPGIFSHVGHLASDLKIGKVEAIEREYEAATQGLLVERIPFLIVQVFEAIFVAGLLILFYLQRDHVEYLCLAITLAGACLVGAVQDVRNVTATPMVAASLIEGVGLAIGAMAMFEFVFRFIREPMPKWLRAYQFCFPLILTLLFAFWTGWISNTQLNVGYAVFMVPYWFCAPGVLMWRFLRGNREAGLLAIPVTLLMLEDLVDTFGWVLWELHLRKSSAAVLPDLYLWTVAIKPEVICQFVFVLAIAGLVLVRFQHTRLEQAQAHAELEAARNMQEVMVPKSIAANGFQIETAYIPAREVGGDFFQLFPGEDDSLLVVIGDVSGKGLKAAMLVSMIVGMLRKTVDESRSPEYILSSVNRLLIGQTDGRFATCCCALLRADGSMTAANAGHLSPYCDGEEIELPGGVPLGISADSEYHELHVPKLAAKRVVFLSDGVVEARNKSGELYGFDRTRSISIQGASEIAESAQRFGQEDDITVLGIVAFA